MFDLFWFKRIVETLTLSKCLHFCQSLSRKLFESWNFKTWDWCFYKCSNLFFIIDDFTQRCTLGSETILATESPLTMLKNAFYITSEALFVLKRFIFFWISDLITKRFDQKHKVNLTNNWLTNNCNASVIQYLEKWRQSQLLVHIFWTIFP